LLLGVWSTKIVNQYNNLKSTKRWGYARWIDYTNHAALAMAALGTVEENWIGASNINSECLVDDADEAAVEAIGSRLAWCIEVALRDGVGARGELENNLSALWCCDHFVGVAKPELGDMDNLGCAG
jgi:hypothetical protein